MKPKHAGVLVHICVVRLVIKRLAREPGSQPASHRNVKQKKKMIRNTTGGNEDLQNLDSVAVCLGDTLRPYAGLCDYEAHMRSRNLNDNPKFG